MDEHLSRADRVALARADYNRSAESKLSLWVLGEIMRQLARLKPESGARVLLAAARQHRERMEQEAS
jgi:hypothetical protein